MSHSVDYPGAIGVWVPDGDTFTTFNPIAVVIHKTADPGATPQDIANFFIKSSPGPSVHYIVGLDGTIVQCVPENRGAGGNCCLNPGHDPFWDQYAQLNADGTTSPNLNTLTFSIEHCIAQSNDELISLAQGKASFALVLSLCHKYKIDAGHIKGHSTIAPRDKPDCPGNYPFAALVSYVQQGLAQAAASGIAQQAQDTWNATKDLYNMPIPVGTGIYQAWLAEYLKGNNYGPPITKEWVSVDWENNVIVCQQFGAGVRIEYYIENVGGHQAGEYHVYSLAGRLF